MIFLGHNNSFQMFSRLLKESRNWLSPVGKIYSLCAMLPKQGPVYMGTQHLLTLFVSLQQFKII